MSVSIVLASRGRPSLLKWTIEQTLEKISRPDTQFVVALDDDDKWTLESVLPEGPIYSILPREDSVGEKANRVLKIAPAEVYIYMVDYAPFATKGFDELVLAATQMFPDGIGVIYNHMVTTEFPGMNAVTHRLADLMGEIYPTWFPYWFTDHWLDDIARMIGYRIAVAPVKSDYSRRPGTRDYREPAFWATLYDALACERRKIAERIFDASDFVCSDWQKRLLRNHWPLIEQRSEKINNNVRRSGNLMAVPSDERYQRIRARAVEKLREISSSMEAA